MGKRTKRLWDDERTELLNQAELWVEKGKGTRNYFVSWPIEPDVDCCPLCGGSVIKMQDLFSKTYSDLIRDDGQNRVISLEYCFYKWRCLNENCRHIFARDIGFATKYDNVTHRLENEIARLVVSGFSYGEISNQFDNSITRQAVGQIFNRWVRNQDEQRKVIQPPRHLAVLSMVTDNEGLCTIFLNLDDGIKIFDVLYGVYTQEIATVFRKMIGTDVQTVLTDCDPIITSVVKDHSPNAVHIIPVEYWFKLVADDFKNFAHDRIKWCSVSNKEKLIMASKSELGWRESDLNRLLKMRPKIVQPYIDFNHLREIIDRRDVLWVYDELVDWIQSVDNDFRKELAVTEYQLSYYRQEIEAHTEYRDAVPERLYLLTEWLEDYLREQRVFSTEVLKAKLLYAGEVDLDNWTGVPIEDALISLENNEFGGIYNEYE